MHILLLILYIQLVICSTSTRSDSVGAALRLLGVVRLLMAAAQEAAQEAAQQLETLETLSCKNLKQVLAAHNVGFEGVVEKEELIRLARRALTDLIGANEVEDGDGAVGVLFAYRKSRSASDVQP